jgi:hypothetical protein
MHYGLRAHRTPNAILNIDHIAGIYAISGTMVVLATLVLHLQPYEWDDKNDDDDPTHRFSDLDTSSAWVYESFTAMQPQLLTWFCLWMWNFARIVVDEDAPSRTLNQQPKELLMEILSPTGVVAGVILSIGSVLMVPTIYDLFISDRGGYTWANCLLRISYFVGAVIARVVLVVMAMIVAGVVWWQAFRELHQVMEGRLQPWNADWAIPNPVINKVLDAVLSLYAKSRSCFLS